MGGAPGTNRRTMAPSAVAAGNSGDIFVGEWGGMTALCSVSGGTANFSVEIATVADADPQSGLPFNLAAPTDADYDTVAGSAVTASAKQSYSFWLDGIGRPDYLRISWTGNTGTVSIKWTKTRSAGAAWGR